MVESIHRDSFSAWKALCENGGLEPNDRDSDLINQLTERLHPGENDLEKVLRGTPTGEFLQALFQVLQPFSLMYEQILKFFERADAREGQNQWKVIIRDDVVGYEHFQEFLDHWKKMHQNFEIPRLDQRNAFILNSVRIDDDNYRYLREDENDDGSVATGISDVDRWIQVHDQGEYIDFPSCLDPQKFPSGLNDAARITQAAILTIQRSGMNRKQLIEEHRERGYKCVPEDALHLWTIAQSETDYWIRSSILYLAALSKKSKQERDAFGLKLSKRLTGFPRRHFAAEIIVNDFEKLLSLPAWKKRYEFYGVWVATQIIQSCDGHDYTLNSKNGEFKFSFSEAKLADIHSSRPPLEFYSERYTKATNLLGESRFAGVQPDFGIWEAGDSPNRCRLIAEVKHYKKRSKRNFRDALIDYANAHPKAQVILVNYGSVGADFDDLPTSVKNRCQMIGNLRPDNLNVVTEFHKFVRQLVGEPYVPIADVLGPIFLGNDALMVDVSGSMAGILNSDWFKEFIHNAVENEMKVYLVDRHMRASLPAMDVQEWLQTNSLNGSTSLTEPVLEVLTQHSSLILLTDQEGSEHLKNIDAEILPINLQ